MSKTDFKKEFKVLYQPSKKDFQIVDVPLFQFLMIDGHGDPNSAPEYSHAVEALYAVAYKIKFISKNDGQDYVVPPLEGLWWAEDMDSFTTRDKSQWDWTMMIMTPDWITQDIYDQAVDDTAQKKNLPSLSKLCFESFQEGVSAQILHLGSYDDEGPVLARLHTEWMPENRFDFNGKHHEIYLSDPRRVAPEKLKTILRQPIRNV
ncbi:MAG: GyrI-like domain-containing protein [Anaerolineales bacterium]|nr:GyrI-like domain-containing protein [Anaerolineales bacterium]